MYYLHCIIFIIYTNLVFYELKAACKTFLSDNMNSSNLGSTKILKRCRVLMTCIKDMRTYYVQHEIPQCTDTGNFILV